MKLYQSVGPNPRVATMFIAEKGISIERIFVDIQGGENRKPPYLAINPHGATPCLALDDGSYLSDSVAICEYLEEVNPGTPIVGATPKERAATRSVLRHVDQNVVVPMVNGFRSAEGLPMFKGRMFCSPEGAPMNKAYAQDGLQTADRDLAHSAYLAGDHFSLADILLFCLVEFGAVVGQPVPDRLINLKTWHARIAARPSAAFSADPKNGVT